MPDADEVSARYKPLINLIAALYADDADVRVHLESIRVFKEEWDSNRAGGHFWFEASTSGPPLSCETVDAQATDPDGMPIEIILHFVGPGVDWGEWFRNDAEPVMCWPPSSVERVG